MDTIDIQLDQGRIQGTLDSRFSPVLDAFIENFKTRGELGASVALSLEGHPCVDLWGGHKDGARTEAWEADTVSLVFSVTKAATALCAHRLVHDGAFALHDPVRNIWPEFAQAGKEDATVAMMLNHSVGVPAFREALKPGAYLDWDYMVDRLAQEAPFWTPGVRNGYHMMSFGWTVGELVRRASGKSLGTYFKDQFAEPLGLDFAIGLPAKDLPRVAPMVPFKPGPDTPITDFTKALLSDPTSISALSLLNSGDHNSNAPEALAAELGGGGGVSNARSVAKLFAPLAAGGGAFFTPEEVARMSAVSAATQQDATLLIPSRFALGFMKSMDNRARPHGAIESCILSETAFGHVGAGGSLGFADPACNLAFGYTMNAMGAGLLLNDRGQSLVDATYESLGYGSSLSGGWLPSA